jgi:hypothetical protein
MPSRLQKCELNKASFLYKLPNLGYLVVVMENGLIWYHIFLTTTARHILLKFEVGKKEQRNQNPDFLASSFMLFYFAEDFKHSKF